jgi:hypothetical protein
MMITLTYLHNNLRTMKPGSPISGTYTSTVKEVIGQHLN